MHVNHKIEIFVLYYYGTMCSTCVVIVYPRKTCRFPFNICFPIRHTQYLVFYFLFCKSLLFLLSLPLHYMSFFDLRLPDYPIGVFKRFMSHNVEKHWLAWNRDNQCIRVEWHVNLPTVSICELALYKSI
jgi:hypothetical protein